MRRVDRGNPQQADHRRVETGGAQVGTGQHELRQTRGTRIVDERGIGDAPRPLDGVLRRREHRVLGRRRLECRGELRDRFVIVRPAKDRAIDEAVRETPRQRECEHRRHPQQQHHRERARIGVSLGRLPAQQRNDDAGERGERRGHQHQERNRVLQEQIGEREAIVLMQDGKRERQRRMMADELDPPRLGRGMPREVQRRYGKHRERDDPDAAATDRLPPCREQQRHRQRAKAGGRQPQRRT
jgi:hypothetical protein